MEKQFDAIYMGHMTVDPYSQQTGTRLEDVSSFAKYLGGLSGSVAYGAARQGLCSSTLTWVDNEYMGCFLHEELNQIGRDTDHLITDKDHLTVLVLLGIKDRDTFPLIFHRDNCTDMVITASDADEQYIASARCLAITGAHFSHPQTRETVLATLAYARRHGMCTALGINYCPVLWGLISLGDGEIRFIIADQVTHQLQEVLHLFDVIVGAGEEFHVAGGSIDTLQALSQVRGMSYATLVCRHGALGCPAYTDAIPARLDDDLTVIGVRVEVLNVLGTGDAFMSGLLRSHLNDKGWEQACRYASACGVLVASRHGYVPAMSSKVEPDDCPSRAAEAPRPNLDPHLNYLHRMATRRRIWSELCVMAFNHRNQLEDMALQCGASLKRTPTLKQLILQVSREAANSAGPEGKVKLLYDDTFSQDAPDAITGEGWRIGRPIELPGSRPLEMGHSNIGLQLISWSQEHVVKRLVFLHPEGAHALRLEQEQKIAEVYRACRRPGHKLLLEMILPASMPRSNELYLRIISRSYNLGIYPDWWRLPLLTSAGWTASSDIVEWYDPYCHDMVILGLDIPAEQLRTDFKAAAGRGVVKGFAVGRMLFGDASRAWLKHDIDDAQLVARIKDNYLQLVA